MLRFKLTRSKTMIMYIHVFSVDDWDFNGEELLILLEGSIIERYTKKKWQNLLKDLNEAI